MKHELDPLLRPRSVAVVGASARADSIADIESRLGSRVILAKMAPAGVEMFLGARTDPQFGPVVMLGFGGVLAETIADIIFALAPFDAAYARRRLYELKLHALMDGLRGRLPCNTDAFCVMAEKFSIMVDALRDDLSEIDVNPVIVGNKECLPVDALIVGRNKKAKYH